MPDTLHEPGHTKPLYTHSYCYEDDAYHFSSITTTGSGGIFAFRKTACFDLVGITAITLTNYIPSTIGVGGYLQSPELLSNQIHL